jgi:SAM-dependent methyltransferase
MDAVTELSADAAAELTRRARTTWGQGNFARAGAEQVIVGELLARAVDIHPGERVLDVASGSGNAALAAARRGARVTATDFVPALLEVAARRAEVEGLELTVLSTDMCAPSPAARVAFARAHLGPTKAVFERLDAAAQVALADELEACFERFNRATDGTLVAPSDYLQVVATRTS